MLYQLSFRALSFGRLLSCVAVMLAGAALADETQIDYSRDVRPILSDACFRCHGPDEMTREADLRLDEPKGLFAARDGSPAVVPGDPDASLVLQRVLSTDPDLMMPPPSSNKTLSPQQKDILVRWVQQGAKWEQHWSFVKPEKPAVPDVQNADWCRNEIDRFILQRQQAAGLTPSSEASPETLVRRLYLDLIGLPPTIDQAEHWVQRLTDGASADSGSSLSEEAWQQLVDHLLQSPHYGERWARRWLDLARYADTNGYEKDRERSIWPYRDWVVQAINQGMPFDQFTVQQLAGDMLPEATVDQHTATGFHRNTMLNEEGGIDPLEFRYHAMTDRVATTGTTWLGLTLGCCQCHTHKYDPISHTEYFQVMAFLNNADEPVLELPRSDREAIWASNRQQAEKLLQQLPAQWPVAASEAGASETDSSASQKCPQAADPQQQQMLAAFADWRRQQQPHAVTWENLVPETATSNLPILTIQDDHSIFASGDTAKRDDYQIILKPLSQPITALRLEALPDPRLPAGGPGSTYYEGTLGDFYLTEITASSGSQTWPFAGASHTFAKNRYGNNPAGANLAIDQDIQTGWSVHGRQAERHVAVFRFQQPVPAGTKLKIDMAFGRHFASSLGRFRFSATSAASEPEARTWSPEISQLLTDPERELSPAEHQFLLNTFLMQAPEVAKAAQKIRDLQQPPPAVTTLVLAERPVAHPRPTFRHHRGEYLQPQEPVSAGLPAILQTSLPESPRDRLEFARWLVSEQNPLTARVIVNRHWAAIFGTGLVKTVDDFGLQGESPSHPELLDWLAVTFQQDDKWSVKELHRRIVSSATWRQAAVFSDAAERIDPDNRLLSHSPRYRLDAEVIRDQLLVAAGVLNAQIGGPPVHPPQPAGVTEAAYGRPGWPTSSGDARYRRSLYTFTKRTAPFAMLSTFDAPSGEACIAQRDRSNSPLQALTLLNDVMLMDLARQTGRQFGASSEASEAAASGIVQQLDELFQRVLVRPPTAAERQLLSEFWETQHAAFLKEPSTAATLLQLDAKAIETTVPAETAVQAAWTATARAIFGLDETLTRE